MRKRWRGSKRAQRRVYDALSLRSFIQYEFLVYGVVFFRIYLSNRGQRTFPGRWNMSMKILWFRICPRLIIITFLFKKRRIYCRPSIMRATGWLEITLVHFWRRSNEQLHIFVISTHYISHGLHTNNKRRLSFFTSYYLIIIDFHKPRSRYDKSVTTCIPITPQFITLCYVEVDSR